MTFCGGSMHIFWNDALLVSHYMTAVIALSGMWLTRNIFI